MAVPLTIKNMTAIVIGNALEWYDFVVYSFMTIYIAAAFFPNSNNTSSLLAAMATFGVAFFMRPFGGIVLGFCPDRYGRKFTMTLIITLMTIALFMISFCPTYAQIGMVAPVMIVIARLIQGFSAGGEFGTSMAMLTELSPPHQRGYYCSWQMVGQVGAMLFGSSIGLILTSLFSHDEMIKFGWRIPFVVGLIIAPVGYYIRRHMKETLPLIRNQSNADAMTRITVRLRDHFHHLLIAMGLVIGCTVTNYINTTYIPIFSSIYLGIPIHDAYLCVSASTILMCLTIPYVGAYSDAIGRKRILITSLLLYVITVVPLFDWLISSPSFARLLTIELVFSVLIAGFFGVFAVVMADIFPLGIRSTALGISYNLMVMMFGGFAQFIVTTLIKTFHSLMAITYYLLFAMVIALVAAVCYRERRKHE